MKLGWIVCFAIVITQLLNAQSESEKKAAEDSHLLGYSSQTSQQQKDWEKKFRDGIVPDNIRENMRRLSARPHNVGSPYDKDNAEWILSRSFFTSAAFRTPTGWPASGSVMFRPPQ